MSDSDDLIVFSAEEGAVYAGVLDVIVGVLEIPESQRVQLLLLRDRLSGEFDGTK